MQITIANKRLNNKPYTQKEKGTYFKDLRFKQGNFKVEDLNKIIGNGYTLTYLYKDCEFVRDNGYMVNNYVGTQFICIDVDECDIPPASFIEKIKYIPTVVHTTFSNLSERKDYKYCYHLLYCFDEIIYGEENFQLVFNKLCEDYRDKVDEQAKDCHRVIFSSNSSLPHYEYYASNIEYKVNDFIKEETYDDLNSFFGEYKDNGCDKNSVADISLTSSLNISEETKVSQDTSFTLDKQFFYDMNTMKRSEFIYTYSSTYPYITETYIDPERYENGYVDLRNDEYYVVPTAQFRWNADTQRAEIPKTKIGTRNTMMWLDALCFMKIVPNLTKEYLVYLLTTEVYRNFDNSDKELTNQCIIDKCKEVWNNNGKYIAKPIRKMFKIDKDYWRERGMDNWLSITNYIRKIMKCEDMGSLYDPSLTIEGNITMFKEFGLNTTPKSLKAWLDVYGIPYQTNKDVRNELVLKLYDEDNTRSCRDIEELCKQNNISVSYRTILRLLKRCRHEK